LLEGKQNEKGLEAWLKRRLRSAENRNFWKDLAHEKDTEEEEEEEWENYNQSLLQLSCPATAIEHKSSNGHVSLALQNTCN